MESIPQGDTRNSIVVAGITVFYQEPVDLGDYGEYPVFTKHPKHGLQLIRTEYTAERAQQLVESTAEDIRKCIEKKRKGKPTPWQLSTLFSLRVPIALDLTFGDASDAIDIALTQKRNERAAKRQLKQDGAA